MIQKNILANFLGKGIVGVLEIIATPFYFRYLGVEFYGLIGIYLLMQAWIMILDVGMAPTLSREIAQTSFKDREQVKNIKNLIRSIETVAYPIAFLIGILVFTSADWISSIWLDIDSMHIKTASVTISMMGFLGGIKFLQSIYKSAIIGLQEQVKLNNIYIITAVIRIVGGVILLKFFNISIVTFFILQIFVELFTLLILCNFLYKLLPMSEIKGGFNYYELKRIYRFSIGMSIITIQTMLLSQLDKLILSHYIDLKNYGIYTAILALTGIIFHLASPITQAYAPELYRLHKNSDSQKFIDNFHISAILISTLIGSVSIFLIFNSVYILEIWTGNLELAQENYTILIILTIGNLLNGFCWIPYQAQIAHGWLKLSIYSNIVTTFIIVPSLLYFVPIFGAKAAAILWLILNVGYLTIGMHFMFRKILIHEKRRWYFRDIGKPILGSIIGTGLISMIFSVINIHNSIYSIALAIVFSFAGSILATKEMRYLVMNIFRPI